VSGTVLLLPIRDGKTKRRERGGETPLKTPLRKQESLFLLFSTFPRNPTLFSAFLPFLRKTRVFPTVLASLFPGKRGGFKVISVLGF